MLVEEQGYSSNLRQLFADQNSFQEDCLLFTGHKSRTKEELQKLMYRKVITDPDPSDSKFIGRIYQKSKVGR